MEDMMFDALEIIGVCLLIAIVAVSLVIFRPTARRRRRRKRHAQRPRIDLFAPPAEDLPPVSDA
jgi:hypothetical protein